MSVDMKVIENALMSYAEDNISSDKEAQKELDNAWKNLMYNEFLLKYNEKAKEILWSYISDKDIDNVEYELHRMESALKKEVQL